MKDLILIGAHCPDEEREFLLNKCVDALQSSKNDFDILICSHTEIPSYISKKVDYVFYDKNNDLITDLKYLNQPWFSPTDGITILSTYIGQHSTYLAVYRLLIAGLGLAKLFKYQKVHYVEYDTIMNDLSELYDNNLLLDEYDSVVIQKEQRNFELNLAWPMGNFMSFKVESINDLFLTYDKEKLLEILLKSESKTNEKITNDILRMNNNRVFVKNFDNIKNKNISFALSNQTTKDELNYWAVPFYHSLENQLFAVVWNNKSDDPINVNFLINDENVLKFHQVKKFEWRMQPIGNIENVNSVLVIVNGKIKTNITLNDDNKHIFKTTNYSIHS